MATLTTGERTSLARKDLSQTYDLVDLEAKYELTQEQISQARTSLERHISTVRHNRDHRGLGAFPSWDLHKAGEQVRGTVLLLHGLAEEPEQFDGLASYLFQNGFNTYECGIAGHEFKDADKYWPKVALADALSSVAREKLDEDPMLKELFDSKTVPTDAKTLKTATDKLRHLKPWMNDVRKVLDAGDTSKFGDIMTSTHEEYLYHLSARLEEVSTLPGPVTLIGQDVGGSIALAFAASHPDRVAKVVAFDPLLQLAGDAMREFVHVAGPLGFCTTSEASDKLEYSLGVVAAAEIVGVGVTVSEALYKLARIPTLIIEAENDSLADPATNRHFNDSLTRKGGRVAHVDFKYPARLQEVASPVFSPGKNRYWRRLHQQTLNFVRDGEFYGTEVLKEGLDTNLPPVMTPEELQAVKKKRTAPFWEAKGWVLGGGAKPEQGAGQAAGPSTGKAVAPSAEQGAGQPSEAGQGEEKKERKGLGGALLNAFDNMARFGEKVVQPDRKGPQAAYQL